MRLRQRLPQSGRWIRQSSASRNSKWPPSFTAQGHQARCHRCDTEGPAESGQFERSSPIITRSREPTTSTGGTSSCSWAPGGETRPYPVYGGNGINGYHDEYLISEPTLIIGRVGAKCGVTHITLKNSWITDNALIASPLVRSFDKRYFKYLLEHKNLNVLGSSTGQPVISGAKIYAVRIPLPTLAEQIQIADIIEKANSSIDELTTEIDDQLLQADVFRQSLLKKAFSGQLVPQDPNDEPASVLLDRIRAEIVKTVKNNHYKKTKKRKTTA